MDFHITGSAFTDPPASELPYGYIRCGCLMSWVYVLLTDFAAGE